MNEMEWREKVIQCLENMMAALQQTTGAKRSNVARSSVKLLREDHEADKQSMKDNVG